MEDALVPFLFRRTVCYHAVLILVLMEDALVPFSSEEQSAIMQAGLNPCFNGRCTRTSVQFTLKEGGLTVLILVLMEDALVLLKP